MLGNTGGGGGGGGGALNGKRAPLCAPSPRPMNGHTVLYINVKKSQTSK